MDRLFLLTKNQTDIDKTSFHQLFIAFHVQQACLQNLQAGAQQLKKDNSAFNTWNTTQLTYMYSSNQVTLSGNKVYMHQRHQEKACSVEVMLSEHWAYFGSLVLDLYRDFVLYYCFNGRPGDRQRCERNTWSVYSEKSMCVVFLPVFILWGHPI